MNDLYQVHERRMRAIAWVGAAVLALVITGGFVVVGVADAIATAAGACR